MAAMASTLNSANAATRATVEAIVENRGQGSAARAANTELDRLLGVGVADGRSRKYQNKTASAMAAIAAEKQKMRALNPSATASYSFNNSHSLSAVAVAALSVPALLQPALALAVQDFKKPELKSNSHKYRSRSRGSDGEDTSNRSSRGSGNDADHQGLFGSISRTPRNQGGHNKRNKDPEEKRQQIDLNVKTTANTNAKKQQGEVEAEDSGITTTIAKGMRTIVVGGRLENRGNDSKVGAVTVTTTLGRHHSGK
jgi:hypothetical protein